MEHTESFHDPYESPDGDTVITRGYDIPDDVIKLVRGYIFISRDYEFEQVAVHSFKSPYDFESFLHGTSLYSPFKHRGGLNYEDFDGINFLHLPLDDGMNDQHVQWLLRHVTANFSLLLGERNATTTTGRISCSYERDQILLETPKDSVPYLYLSLSQREGDDFHRLWSGIFAHCLRSASRGVLGGFNPFNAHVVYKLQKAPVVERFVSMTYSVVLEYIVVIEQEAKAFMDEIQLVEESLQLEERSSLSALLRQINTISRKIRASTLEEQCRFGVEAADWIHRFLMRSDNDLIDPDTDLLGSARRMQKYHPDRLKESIAEVRQHIADVAAEEKQARDEVRQQREDMRQKLKDELREERERKRQSEEDERQERKENRYKLEDARQQRENDLREEREKEYQKQEDERQKREKDRQIRADAQQEKDDLRAAREEQLLAQSIRIAEETQRDSRTMRGIAWVTIAFLPATFVSSFFGMNFFNGIPGDVPFDQASRSVWLFFVVAVPISGIVLLTFYYWDKQEKKKDDLRLRVEEEAATTLQDESKTVTPVENGMEMSDLS